MRVFFGKWSARGLVTSIFALTILAACQSKSGSEPSVTLTPQPSVVDIGSQTSLIVQSTAVDQCVGTSGITGPQPTNGTITSPPITQDTTFTVTCSGSGGSSTATTQVTARRALPTVSLTAAATTIAGGAQTVLTWNSAHTDFCSASGGWNGNLPTSGTRSTGPLLATTEYTIECGSNADTSSATQSVTVTVNESAPVIQLSATPSTVFAGSTVILNYSVANATACTASGGNWTGTPALPSGSVTTTPVFANTTYSLSCSGSGGNASQSVTVSVTQPVPTVSISAAASTIASHTATTISWSSSNATSCTATGAWSGSKTLSGSVGTGNLSTNQTFTLTCAGPGGSATQSTIITVSATAPTVNFSVGPSSITAGGVATLTWSASNATSCLASGGWSGAKPVSGTQSTGALTTTTSYTLTCTGAGGSASQAATVSVSSPAPTVTISASPSTILSGNASTLSWSSTNATSCIASGGWSGSKAMQGSGTTGAIAASTTYNLSCAGAGGSASQSAIVSVTPPAPVVSISASPGSVNSGSMSILSWNATNATSCTASGGWTGAEATNGSQSTVALSAKTKFVLGCTGFGGTASNSVTVSVNATAPTVSLSAGPTNIASGSSSTLTWSSINASSCSASGAWSGTLAINGSQAVSNILNTATYTLTCSNSVGSSSINATVTVTPVHTGTAPTSWTITCLDNQCISITDSRLTAGQTFLVSTLSASGAPLGSYSLMADSSNRINIRPSSFAELTALNDSAGLTIAIAASGTGQNPNIKFVALKTVTGFSQISNSSNLLLNLNTNSSAQSTSYSIEFLDSTQKLLQTLTGVTPTNSTLIVNLAALQPNVVAAYNGNGIYVVLTNSQNQSLPGAYYTNAGDIGGLNDFYSAAQLQGEMALSGQGLLNINSDLGYLLSPSVDVPYKSRFDNEIPFAHTFSITRFLGGYSPSAVQLLCTSNAGITTYANYCTPTYNPGSLDYVVNAGGSLSYQTALMLDRVSPYINAGYSPSDITLVLKNVPWAMASNAAPQHGSACVPQSIGGTLGTYGQCNPPASYSQWASVITHLANDLQNAYPANAEQFNFAVGDEYDQSSNFNGQSSDFYSLYEGAYKSIKSVLPAASMAAGDYTGACYASGARNPPGCVYDSGNFFSREVMNGSTPSYEARSLNLYWDMNPTAYPSAAVSTAIASYAYVAAPAKMPFEMHQFGFLHMPWGASGGTVVSSLQANWEFQTLMGLKKNLPYVSRVFNWGGFATIKHGTPISFLEGAGYIRMILDNHQGAELYELPVSGGSLPPGNEVMAVALVEGNSFQIVVSNTDVVAINPNLALMEPHAPTPISITIPASWVGTTNWSYLRYSQAMIDNVFAQIKRDFANATPQSILDPKFAQCVVCFSDPLSMATDATAARTILLNNWTNGSNYVHTMQSALKWNPVTSRNAANQLNIDQNGIVHAFGQSGGTLNVTVGPNEMLVLKPN